MKIISEATHSPTGRIEQPTIGQCDACQKPVALEGFTNLCVTCGAEYDSYGHRLAPRMQWFTFTPVRR